MDHACQQALKQARALCGDMQQIPVFCRAALLLGQADLAIDVAEEQLAQFPGSVDAMLLLALALRAYGRQPERTRQLLEQVVALDRENPSLEMLELLSQTEGEKGEDKLMQYLVSLRPEGEAAENHQELVRLLRMPVPGMAELAVQLMIQAHDAVGLRLALLESELPPMLYALILNALTEAGEPLPCLARVQGRLCLLPQKPRPPYDADLHDLIRRLLRLTDGSVALDTIVEETPDAWNRLPESARRHCAQSEDNVWPAAFAAYLSACEGRGEEADEWLNCSRHPRRAGRAYMQLLRRSKRLYEMH